MIFDLGGSVPVVGARITARSDGGADNPKLVDFFHFADDDPRDHPVVDDLGSDPGIKPLLVGQALDPLIQILRDGHDDVCLPREDWVRLVTWVDANGPYYGAYFGRRNLKYRDWPDFRPVPTLPSARGIAPDFAQAGKELH
jgi:hypothetical protein